MDGCTDNTVDIVRKFAKQNLSINTLVYDQRLGKGGAIIQGFHNINGDVVFLLDADGSFSYNDVLKMYELIDDYDIIIGSRYMKSTKMKITEPFIRKFFSRSFNVIIKLFFFRLKNIKDTQCGIKAIKRSVVTTTLNELVIPDFAFDVNLIYSALKHDYKIHEMGVTWTHVELGSKLSSNLLRISFLMLLSLIKLRLYYSPLTLFFPNIKPVNNRFMV